MRRYNKRSTLPSSGITVIQKGCYALRIVATTSDERHGSLVAVQNLKRPEVEAQLEDVNIRSFLIILYVASFPQPAHAYEQILLWKLLYQIACMTGPMHAAFSLCYLVIEARSLILVHSYPQNSILSWSTKLLQTRAQLKDKLFVPTQEYSAFS